MKKVTVEAPAKINLTIDVVGEKDGFHLIKSFVATINLCDKLTFKKREDDKIIIHDKGKKCLCEPEKNNAYKTAKAFMEKFNTSGVDVYIKKKIPVGGGLGGSSADIAGTLKGLALLFDVEEELLPIANSLGSDSGYLMLGGYKVISGRGEIIEDTNAKREMYLIIIPDKDGISARECYEEFDKLGSVTHSCTAEAVELFRKGDEDFYKVIKNDLYLPALKFLPQLQAKIKELESAGAKKALMTGSGSCVYGIFESKKAQEDAYKLLKKKYGKTLIKAKTI